LLFTYLIYGLAAIGAMVIGLSVAVGIAYVIVAKRLSQNVRQMVEDMERVLAGSLAAARNTDSVDDGLRALVPPMRIHLARQTSSPNASALTKRIEDWLLQHSFDWMDEFIIEELPGERLRVFLSEDRCLVAAIRFSPEATEPYVEFCIDLGEGRRGGVSNPPSGTLDLPSDAIGSFHSGRLSENFPLLSRMWLEVKDLVDEHEVTPVAPARIAEFFEEAHTCEMDYRVAQGGVSEQEVRSALTAQGLEPSEEDVAEIQEQWQNAIEEHLLDFSSRAQNHQYSGGTILIVYNGSVRSYLMNRILDMLDDVGSLEGVSREELLSIVAELRELLNRFSPREAMARFRPLLPPAIRYSLVDQLKQPVEADLYLLQSTARV
jgi:hypothetical protein